MNDDRKRIFRSGDVRPVKEDKGYVYVLRVESENVFKIGYTTNIDRRIYELKLGKAYNVTCVFSHLSTSCQQTEQLLHRTFEHKKLSGEWFFLTEEDLNKIRKMFNERI